jgi:GT2 family glycosyltransferase
MKDWLWFITTWGNSKYLKDLLSSMAQGEPNLILNQKESHKSLGWAWNMALAQLADYRSVIIANDDITVTPDTGERLYKILNLIGRKTNTIAVSAYDTTRHGEFGNIWVPSKLLFPGMYCFIVDERMEREIGQFDEGFTPYLYEDVDMFHRVKLAGYDWATAVPIKHVGNGSSTNKAMVNRRTQAYDRNKARYIRKWGGDFNEEKYTIPWDGKDAEN